MSSSYARDWREILLERFVERCTEDCTHHNFATLDYFDVYATAEMKAALRDQLLALKYKDFLHTWYWRIVRAKVMHLRGRRCGKCREYREIVDVHHTSYQHHGEEHRFLDELHVRCRECHQAAHQVEPVRDVMDRLVRSIAQTKAMP